MGLGILGGGLTGLTIGYLLKKQNLDFEILEKNNECGGLCRTIQEDGFTFDIAGGHIIFSKDKGILNFKLDILGDNKVRSKRNTKIFYKDRFVKYPFENGLSGLPKEDNFECLNGFIKTLNRKYNTPKNFNEWIYQTFGKGIAEKYMIPYNEKIWNFKTENMATFWVDGRIPKPPSEDIIKSSLGIETEGYTHQSYFHYPKQGGIQALIHPLEEKIKDKITKEFRITSIKKEEGKWVVYGNNEKKVFDQIVSTMPLIDLVNLLDEVPEEIINAINKLKYNSLITVMLGLDTDKLNDLHWLYIPNRNVLPHRIVFPKNNSFYMTPEGKSSVVAEITFNDGDNISRMKDDEIIKKVIDDLDDKKIIDKNLVCYRKIIRLKYAYVVYDLEYEKNIIKIHKFFEGLGIDLCGRFSEYKYLNMDACIKSARDYVKNNNFIQ
ncbi:MAG: FAD-dependent oxidoreductase [Candidatus Aenigmarchaeota archaeon]|nr:FAD-dependent oxidoreductase [Candidatus Aenigmarchaeota archaeon]